MKGRLPVVLAAAACVSFASARAASGPPDWAYAISPPPSTPSTAPTAPRQPDQTLHHIDGSRFEFTTAQIGNGFGPADWFPDDHPPMPEVVAHGRNPGARACGLCHYPNGKGRPENAPVAGLPYDYIVQQLSDFRHDLRHSAEPRKENTVEMIQIAKALSEDEIAEAAKYFSSMSWTPWIRVVETDTIPKMRLSGGMFLSLGDSTTEALGRRIVESPENTQATLWRNPRSGFVAYVPIGSTKQGEELSTTGGRGRTLPCISCHGIDLKGLGPVPGIAGRSPSYLARQLYDMQQGTRAGPLAVPMKPVVASLTEEDLIALVAYVSSRTR